jgi:Fic family protein
MENKSVPALSQEELDFLEQSNFIERVTDSDSLEQAARAWDYLKSEEKLTIPVVLHTHKILMKNQKLLPEEIGRFRTIPVYIGGREAPKPIKVYTGIEAWCRWVNDVNEDFTEEDLRAQHVRYEEIHPFVDGNGRTGRMFYNWARLRSKKPIHVIWEDDKYEYYLWFKNLK